MKFKHFKFSDKIEGVFTQKYHVNVMMLDGIITLLSIGCNENARLFPVMQHLFTMAAASALIGHSIDGILCAQNGY